MFSKRNMLASIKSRRLPETSEGEINGAFTKNLEDHYEKLKLIPRERTHTWTEGPSFGLPDQ